MESPPCRSTNTRHTSCLQDNVVFSRTGMFSLYVKVTFCLPFPFLRESFKGRWKFRTPMELDRNGARINRKVSSVFQRIISSSVHISFFFLLHYLRLGRRITNYVKYNHDSPFLYKQFVSFVSIRQVDFYSWRINQAKIDRSINFDWLPLLGLLCKLVHNGNK